MTRCSVIFLIWSVPVLVVVTRREKTDKLRTEVSSVARTEQIQQQPAAIQVVTQLLKSVTYLLVKERRGEGRKQGKGGRRGREEGGKVKGRDKGGLREGRPAR